MRRNSDEVGLPMMKDLIQNAPRCEACREGVEPPIPITMAFQPIVDTEAGSVYAYEALVRGLNQEPAGVILAQVNAQNRYAFDQSCRVKAIELASRLGLVETGARLSINFMPGAVYSPAACIQLTLRTAAALHFPTDRLIFEITEVEEVTDRAHLLGIVEEYRRQGFQVALDDLGSGYSGLNLLADLAPNMVKMDMALTRNLDERPAAAVIVRKLRELCDSLGMTLVAEGVETAAEYQALRRAGVHLMQGYLLARPAFEALSQFTLPTA